MLPLNLRLYSDLERAIGNTPRAAAPGDSPQAAGQCGTVPGGRLAGRSRGLAGGDDVVRGLHELEEGALATVGEFLGRLGLLGWWVGDEGGGCGARMCVRAARPGWQRTKFRTSWDVS